MAEQLAEEESEHQEKRRARGAEQRPEHEHQEKRRAEKPRRMPSRGKAQGSTELETEYQVDRPRGDVSPRAPHNSRLPGRCPR